MRGMDHVDALHGVDSSAPAHARRPDAPPLKVHTHFYRIIQEFMHKLHKFDGVKRRTNALSQSSSAQLNPHLFLYRSDASFVGKVTITNRHLVMAEKQRTHSV